jgi:N-formylglutamate amidohydrolase
MRRTHPPLEDDLPVVSTAIHAGHELRAEIADAIAVDAGTRLREEDPYTDRVIRGIGSTVAVDRSRFEVDLNREREAAVYVDPSDAWGLELWRAPLPDEVVERSREQHDAFYRTMASKLDELADDGPFLVLDVHSYNHRRGGPAAPPAPIEENPEVNLGTGTLDRRRWGPLVDRFITQLERCEVRGHPLDVRENVRFRGGHLSRWVNERYGQHGCALAIELKKTFMDEWTGELDDGHLDELRAALHRAVTETVDGLSEMVPR